MQWFLFVLFFLAYSRGGAHTGDAIMLQHHVLTEQECKQIISQIPVAASPSVLPISALPEWAAWDKRIFEVIHNAFLSYAEPYNYKEENLEDSGYRLVRLSPLNDTVGPAVMGEAAAAVLFAVVLLNDDVAGGEWWFPFQASRETTPKCGTLLMFPNQFTHPWGIRKVRLGTLHFLWTTLNKKKV